ncbi:MAG: HNH endonuclease, partial [Jaaginema sp. PMC 1079.18]|nr:HNH endonuclease [Jaaginema sp. PMC 1079.18]
MTSIPQTLNQSVVVFSKNYLPMSRVNIKRAIVLLTTGKAEPVQGFSDLGWQVRSPQIVLYVPAHIRLTAHKLERIWKIPPVNRREVLRRDQNTCQYCGSQQKLTLDHVI